MRYFLRVAVSIAVLASVILLVPRESQHATSGKHPAAPTAAEEGGMPATGSAPAQAKRSGPAAAAGRPRAAAPHQRARAPRVDVLAAPSPPALRSEERRVGKE